ncbi:M20 aminoacylase family protein [Variovorax sp. PBL-E5]|uniref:M20 aminoacylase family protein n=1 Tax=Variovorax sp. PBL-E5 TaxID=434014 RepID=UPI0013182C29|nr:M20 aminoacylase family protein [Variovorax sp. PBL-E5]VTU39100.1 putative hydrolase YxeP [Variovorax sp. PBL-E5]
MSDVTLRDVLANPLFARIRRDLHAHPELGFAEHRTAGIVAERLREWGWEVTTGIGGTGVVGRLRRGHSERMVGLRADMDALPMQEVNDFKHRSRHAGRMHACGHDGHTATLLAAAWALARDGGFDGTVHCIFQPAEEGGQAGAKAMIDDDLFERFPCDAVFSMHNSPGAPQGRFAVRTGPFLASSNRFRIDVQGKGGHASQPDAANDPLVCAAQILAALQTIVSRNRPAQDGTVLSVTQLHGGDTVNVIPDSAWLAGTVRSHDAAVLDLVERRMREIVAGTAQAMGCTARLDFERSYPVLVNHPRESELAKAVAVEMFGHDQVDGDAPRLMNSEDFAFMLQSVPGCYMLIGAGDGGHRDGGHGPGPCLVHNPSYDFNDALIPIGAAWFAAVARRSLADGVAQ